MHERGDYMITEKGLKNSTGFTRNLFFTPIFTTA
jgi:hypothetical protein